MAPPSNRRKMHKNPRDRAQNAFPLTFAELSKKPSIPTRRLVSGGPLRPRRNGGDNNEEGGDGGGDSMEEMDRGSDSEGNEWKMGHVDSDDDSDLDSDEAMGESDEERFAGFTFRGSTSTGEKKKSKSGQGLEEESEDDESNEDGEGFIDLSEMLDRPDSGEEEGTVNEKARGKSQMPVSDDEEGEDSELSDSSMDGESESGEEDDGESLASFSEVEDEEPEDPSKLAKLQEIISSLPSTMKSSKRARENDPNEGKTPGEYNLTIPSTSDKLTVEDLTPTVTDPKLKQSLKLVADNAPPKPSKSGVQGRLSAPLAKRQQDKLDRAAAYEKSKEALGRWTDTVKHSRQADHLHFPLANAPNARLPAPRKVTVLSASQSTPLTELEATISGILKESNLTSEKSIKEFEELKTNKLSVEEVQKRTAELRLARELLYREEIKAKRIKKIKSKSYHRILKKERGKQQNAIEEALALERGGVPNEEDIMERERERAEERMTLRHKQSKWSKGMKDSGRTMWDEEAQNSAVEMAKRSEELRMRIAGRAILGEDEELESSDDEEDDLFNESQQQAKQRLLAELEKLENGDDSAKGRHNKSKLMDLKFMQIAEAARRKENKAEIEGLRQVLEDDGRSSKSDESEEEVNGTGRMTFRAGGKKKKERVKKPKPNRSEFEEAERSSEDENGADSPDEAEVTIVNKASSNILKNPFSQPGVSPLQFPNQKTKAGVKGSISSRPFPEAGEKDDPEPNPWLAQDSTSSLVRPKPQALVAGRSESKNAKINSKLSKDRKQALKDRDGPEPDIEIDMNATLKLASNRRKADSGGDSGGEGGGEDDESAINLVPTKGTKGVNLDQRELVKRAFAGDNVVTEFKAEKKRKINEEGDQVVDTRIPGWGSWTGAGLIERKGKKDNKFLKTIKGVDKNKRKDKKLEKVIINEKRVKKNVKYQASALPFPFESQQQYERSLRIPIGPEWTTKKTFQDSTMPRVMVKQGTVIEPISAPFK